MTPKNATLTIPKNSTKLVYSAPSSIHGTGLFAKCLIAKGCYIGTYQGPTAKRNGQYVLWLTEEDGTIIGRCGRNLLRYLNHSSKPNAEFDGFDLYSLKNIKPNQEITIHYGDDWQHIK